jgi:hypothetical protein
MTRGFIQYVLQCELKESVEIMHAVSWFVDKVRSTVKFICVHKYSVGIKIDLNNSRNYHAHELSHSVRTEALIY